MQQDQMDWMVMQSYENVCCLIRKWGSLVQCDLCYSQVKFEWIQGVIKGIKDRKYVRYNIKRCGRLNMFKLIKENFKVNYYSILIE